MNISSHRYTCTFVALALCASAGQLAHARQVLPLAKPPFTLIIRAEQPIVKIGLTVWVDVSKKNNSDQTLSVYRAASADLDQGGWVYKVEVLDASGRSTPETTFGKHVEGGGGSRGVSTVIASGGYVPLAPGKTLNDRVNVSKLYDLRAGKYTIRVREFDNYTRTFVSSNTITITVTP